MRHSFHMRISLVLAGIASTTLAIANPGKGELVEPKSLAKAIESLPLVTVVATANYSLDPDFLKRNPQIDPDKYKNITETYVVKFKGPLFNISVDYILANGETRPTHSMVFNGSESMTSYGVDSLAMISHGALTAPDNSMILGTVIFLPYSFLINSGEAGKIPLITPTTLAKAFSSFQVDGAKITTDGEFNLKFYSETEAINVVKKSPNSIFPQSFEVFSRSQQPLFSFLCGEVSKFALPNEVFLDYAKNFTVIEFLDGKKLSERRVTIDSISISETESDNEFVIDPSSARIIRDLDQKVDITVPK